MLSCKIGCGFTVPITIGSNVASLGAQRSLAQNSEALSRTFERLSSGMRINRASDDAAGLAVSERLGADARLYSATARNISDGFSLISIANGVLDQQSGILNRLAELAEQSANGSYSSTQRRSLDVEYQQLLKEFGRLGDSTTFNGLSLLRGTRANGLSLLDLQVGINGSSSARITSTSADTASLSGIINRSTLATPDWDGIGGVAVGDIFAFLSFGVSGTPTEEDLRAAFRDQVYFTTTTTDTGEQVEVAVGFINGYWNAPGADTVGVISFYRSEGSEVWTPISAAANQFEFLSGSGNHLINPADGSVYNGTTYTVSNGTWGVSLDLTGLRFLTQGANAGNGSAIDFSGVDTVSRALSSLGVVRSRLNDLSALRGNYGALESRLLSALQLANGSREASLQARSRIVDADMAAETANLALKSILQQAGASILAQANTQPSLALLLLQ